MASCAPTPRRSVSTDSPSSTSTTAGSQSATTTRPSARDACRSHGATAGELDERELFYLRSRGLDAATARSVLTFAFAGAVLERFASPAVVRQVKAGLLERLPGGAALGELA